MPVEIERKFLVHSKEWEKVKPIHFDVIKQGYLFKSKEKTIRIRTKGDKGFITIKGETKGITRSEFEYSIPFEEANELLENMCNKFIFKRRYTFPHGKHVWEIDEFISPKKGLILAEIELSDPNEKFESPNWLDIEVSDDPAYFNANMLDD